MWGVFSLWPILFLTTVLPPFNMVDRALEMAYFPQEVLMKRMFFWERNRIAGSVLVPLAVLLAVGCSQPTGVSSGGGVDSPAEVQARLVYFAMPG